MSYSLLDSLQAIKLFSEIWTHPANRKAPYQALINAIHWQITKRMTGRPSDISYHGLKLRCYPDSHSASRAVYFSGLPDYREMRFILDFLRPGDQFIDVGANIGLYTLLALSAVGPTGYVHSFEPNPTVVRVLNESLQLNSADNVAVHEIGLADTEGVVAFSMTEDDCTAHIVEQSASSARTEIPIGRLDRILDSVPYAMAKFDIEGYEPFAIRGASRLLQEHNPPVMLIEMAGYSERYGITTPDFIAELEQLGYFIAIYHPDSRELQPTIRPWEIPVENVLAVSKERKQFVEDRVKEQMA
ncbi:MAG: FkbM family methyltransferase [Blastocatellia bacterium]